MTDKVKKATELKNVDVQWVSLVSRGANQKTFEIFKSADYEPGEEVSQMDDKKELSKNEKGLVSTLKKWMVDNGFLGEKEEVEKGVSPISYQVNYSQAVEEVNVREGMERIEFMFELLRDTIWNIFYLDEDVENPTEAVREAVQEFSEHIVEIINNEPAQVQKWAQEVKKQKEEGGINEMAVEQKLEELTKGINGMTEMLSGLSDRVEELEKQEDVEETEEEVEKSEEETEEVEDEVVKSIESLTDNVSKAIDKLESLEERVETVEKARDISHDPGDDVEKSEEEISWGELSQ